MSYSILYTTLIKGYFNNDLFHFIFISYKGYHTSLQSHTSKSNYFQMLDQIYSMADTIFNK